MITYVKFINHMFFSLDQGNMLERKYEKRRFETEENVIKKTFEQDIYWNRRHPLQVCVSDFSF